MKFGLKTTKQKAIASVAAVATVAAIGAGFVFVNGAFAPKANPSAPTAITQSDKVKVDRFALSTDAIANAAANLTFAGYDVSVANPISVSAKDGHVMVTETSSDTAANNVWYAPRRAAAIAARLAETEVVTDSATTPIKDITYVVTDADNNVKIAVTQETTAPAVAEAGEQSPIATDDTVDTSKTVTDEVTTTEADAIKKAQPTKEEVAATPAKTDEEKTADAEKAKETAPATDTVLNNSTGFVMSEDTHEGLSDAEKANVGTSGGKAVTDPEGAAITPAAPAPKQENATEPAAPAPENTNNSSSTETNNTTSNSSSGYHGGSSSSSNSTPEKHPVYRTEKRWVVDRAAWSEKKHVSDHYHTSDGADFYSNAELIAYLKKHVDVSYSVVPDYETVYHEEQGHWEEHQVIDHYE